MSWSSIYISFKFYNMYTSRPTLYVKKTIALLYKVQACRFTDEPKHLSYVYDCRKVTSPFMYIYFPFITFCAFRCSWTHLIYSPMQRSNICVSNYCKISYYGWKQTGSNNKLRLFDYETSFKKPLFLELTIDLLINCELKIT